MIDEASHPRVVTRGAGVKVPPADRSAALIGARPGARVWRGRERPQGRTGQLPRQPGGFSVASAASAASGVGPARLGLGLGIGAGGASRLPTLNGTAPVR